MTGFLAGQLAAQGVSTRCLYEDDVAHLDVFAPIRQSFRNGRPDAITALLTVSKTLVREFVHLPRVHLIDALLPGYHYLFGLYPPVRVVAFSTDLHRILRPLRPMIVYLKSDIASAFARVVEERGQEWLDQFMERINRHYRTARYVRTALPLSSIRDVVTFFEEMDQLMLGTVKEWPGKRLVIDTWGRAVDEIEMVLMDSFAAA